jgi:NNP family nitrate/nitrite transporter-like MFS transporter
MSSPSEPLKRTGPDWLERWTPEDPNTWDSGRAWKTLWVTTFNLTLCFATWFLVSALAPKLNNIGFSLTKEQLYWLTAMPGLAGGTLRLIWTFLPPIMGTRKLVMYTSGLLVLPAVGWAIAVQDPTTSFGVLMALSALAGIGGGAFSGFMPSTSYFFPKAKQGTALGVQAGIGNFGVSLVQFITPWIVGLSVMGGSQHFVDAKRAVNKEVWFQNAGYVWVPFILVGTFLAWGLLRSVPVQARGFKDQLDIFKNKHTWLMTVLYVITFGTFSGLAAQFGLLIKNLYGPDVFGAEGVDAMKYAFWGALVGSAARVFSGPFADKLGGAKLTLVSTLGVGAAAAYTSMQVTPTSAAGFPAFFWGMMAIFFFTGVGNASTFKQMPMIFQPRQAGGVIGWTSAIAAYGPFLFGMLLSATAPSTFFMGLAVFSAIGAAITFWFYARPGAEMPS